MQKSGANNFQVFPATLTNSDTDQSWENYYAFNVVGLIKAADMQQSDFDILMEGDAEGIETPLVAFRDIILEKEKIGDSDMFRMAESPVSLVVSKRVVNFLSENKPKGGWGIDAIEIETV